MTSAAFRADRGGWGRAHAWLQTLLVPPGADKAQLDPMVPKEKQDTLAMLDAVSKRQQTALLRTRYDRD
jgi:hypothetical protein